MQRERLAWAVSLVVVAGLSLRLPGSLGQRENDYAFVRTLSEVHRQVAVNYVDDVSEESLRESAIAGMLAGLDGYTEYVPPRFEKEFNRSLEGTFLGVGVFLNRLEGGRFEVVTPIDGSPAAKAGVQAGDFVEQVDGREVAGLSLTELTGRIKGPPGTNVTLGLRRGGERLDLTMPRAEYIVPTVKGFDRKPDNSWNYLVGSDPKLGYCRITQFTDDTLKSFQAALQQMLGEGVRGLVIDLRDNPGGRLDQAIAIADLFLESGTIVSTQGRNRPESVAMASAADGTVPRIPIVVLVDETSASASEVLAGALADNGRATVVGMRTFGKGSVQEVVRLAGAMGELKITVAYYYLPSGRLVHRKRGAEDWGVEPHLRVPVEAAERAAVREARVRSENFRRPQGAGEERTEPKDVQLEQAVLTLRAMLLMTDRAPGTTRP